MAEKIYFISGLGADRRVFRKLVFSEEFEIIYLDWITPDPKESLSGYAPRLALAIDHSAPFYLVGVSFGGFIATEIAKVLKPKHTFIISSAATSNELPWYYRLAGSFRLQKIIPASLLKHTNRMAYWIFGARTTGEKKMLKNILIDTDPVFLKWALNSILDWKNTERPENLTHIHGTGDKIMPIKYVKPDHIIDGGGHLMVYSKAAAVNSILSAQLIS
ncbi:alpha/beta fold hydrolase [Pedobacter metabolipauper]|uniref:Pimeloyl-ACP methyl ester carboxylesterase n=1 Tax=Pedobacter metabolipauper TaxID=425513 RepID=A0A4R6SXZ2_9SPHI|nr:alpha/beta hydrolase [Pedobacter metabolipauper]TDQ11404.1 pimeloyl-ACP methyl ester carboxylesterase [Pedobacter metabolipauper]